MCPPRFPAVVSPAGAPSVRASERSGAEQRRAAAGRAAAAAAAAASVPSSNTFPFLYLVCVSASQAAVRELCGFASSPLRRRRTGRRRADEINTHLHV